MPTRAVRMRATTVVGALIMVLSLQGSNCEESKRTPPADDSNLGDGDAVPPGDAPTEQGITQMQAFMEKRWTFAYDANAELSGSGEGGGPPPLEPGNGLGRILMKLEVPFSSDHKYAEFGSLAKPRGERTYGVCYLFLTSRMPLGPYDEVCDEEPVRNAFEIQALRTDGWLPPFAAVQSQNGVIWFYFHKGNEVKLTFSLDFKNWSNAVTVWEHDPKGELDLLGGVATALRNDRMRLFLPVAMFRQDKKSAKVIVLKSNSGDFTKFELEKELAFPIDPVFTSSLQVPPDESWFEYTQPKTRHPDGQISFGDPSAAWYDIAVTTTPEGVFIRFDNRYLSFSLDGVDWKLWGRIDVPAGIPTLGRNLDGRPSHFDQIRRLVPVWEPELGRLRIYYGHLDDWVEGKTPKGTRCCPDHPFAYETALSN